MFASISAARRSHHDAPQVLAANPVLDYQRDTDDPADPWGDAMLNLGAVLDVQGFDLVHGATVEVTDDDSRTWLVLEALGFGYRGTGDGPYDWPVLVETTSYDPEQRQAWLDHARRVHDRRESYARMLGRDY